jgi:hypothetical protein
MTVEVIIEDSVITYIVKECGVTKNIVVIKKASNIILGEVLDLHDRARDLGFSDGTVSEVR